MFRNLLFLPLIISLLIGLFDLMSYNIGTKKADSAGSNISSYKLVWADEFNQDGQPDTANWTYEHGFVRNEESQWYQPQNAFCKNGLLIIEARREEKPNPNYSAGSHDWRKNRKTIHYTSACLETKGLHSWKYGRFVMRAKIEVNKGLWPAWWTLGIKRQWPANGEIDIMEYYRRMLLANIACLGSDGKAKWYSVRKPLDTLGSSSWSSRFHIWRMDWDKDTIAIYVDNRLMNKTPLDSLANRDGSQFNPFNQSHYMLLNLAVGGINGGNPDETTFPRRFEVDYVRVYQRKLIDN